MRAIDHPAKGTAGGAVQSRNVTLGPPEPAGPADEWSGSVTVTAARGLPESGGAAGIEEYGGPDPALTTRQAPTHADGLAAGCVRENSASGS
ncbi:hypothetical protein ACH4MA_12770 [Streptomyces roseolus]|uniref:hypothetical protein n=1 Tax=Streptomyces roseolus TaxID=67358 RepID=UPI0037A74895